MLAEPQADQIEPQALPDLVLTCPSASTPGPASEIRSRGNCPLEVAGRFLAEIPAPMLRQGLAGARKLTSQKAASLMRDLGDQLSTAGSSEDMGEALDHMLGEAAAFFVLTLRQHRLAPARALHGCRITWHPQTRSGEVEYLG